MKGIGAVCTSATDLSRERFHQTQTYLRLYDLQIPHLDPTGREIWNFKLDAYRSLRFAGHSTHAAAKASHHTTAFLVVAAYTWQTEFSTHEKLFAATELLDFPDDGGGLGRVVDGADVGAEFGRVRVFGNGDGDLDVVGCAAPFELGFGLEVLSVD